MLSCLRIYSLTCFEMDFMVSISDVKLAYIIDTLILNPDIWMIS